MSNSSVVEKYLTALSNQDLDAIVSLYAEDATIEDPVGTSLHIGRAAIRAFYAKATCIELKASLLGDIREAGDFLAFPFLIEMPGDNGKIRMEIIDTFNINKFGLISEMKAYWSKDNVKSS